MLVRLRCHILIFAQVINPLLKQKMLAVCSFESGRVDLDKDSIPFAFRWSYTLPHLKIDALGFSSAFWKLDCGQKILDLLICSSEFQRRKLLRCCIQKGV